MTREDIIFRRWRSKEQNLAKYFWSLWYSQIYEKKYEISSVDLEGVNSPNRGWFKLSLGGDLSQYFKVKL